MSHLHPMDRWKEEDARSYNTVQDAATKQYEDPEYFYGSIGQAPNETQSARRMVVSSPPPPPPPMMQQPTHIAIHSTKKRTTPRWRLLCVSASLVSLCIVLVASIVVFMILGSNARAFFHRQSQASYLPSRPADPLFPLVQPGFPLRRAPEEDISPSHLLTLLITKRKLCLFEAGSGDEQHSRDSFEQDHIESARLLFHSNLSHSGVPVHPLQFQRYARSLGVDDDCHVVIYDRGQVIWSTYAAWVFKLFGHSRVSLLSGGYLAWKTQQGRSQQYKTETGPVDKKNQGAFLASWNQSLIITFDDVFLNSEANTYDIVDAQTKEEYNGIAAGALYGHIRGATNIPVDTVYDWGTGQWLSTQDLATVFQNSGLSPDKPVIVYCSTSLRSSMVWWALSRAGYRAKIYFGGWPEWVVRSPDELKVINTSE